MKRGKLQRLNIQIKRKLSNLPSQRQRKLSISSSSQSTSRKQKRQRQLLIQYQKRSNFIIPTSVTTKLQKVRPLTQKKQSNKKLTLKQIKGHSRFQAGNSLQIPSANFKKLIRAITQQVAPYVQDKYRWQPSALDALQYASEQYVVGFFQDSYYCAQHANRVTLMLKDLHLAKRIRGRVEYFLR